LDSLEKFEREVLSLVAQRKADKIKIAWQLSVQAARSKFNSHYVMVQSDGVPMNNPEERLVAELETIGVRYLSRQSTTQVKRVGSPARFLAELIQQPSSRVRTALIAALLAQPDLSRSIPAALKRLDPDDQLTLKLLYTASVALQKKHADHLRLFLADHWQWLPDLYSAELGLAVNQSPDNFLHDLGATHREQTGVVLNWTGTYESVVHHLLHRWELEKQWKS